MAAPTLVIRSARDATFEAFLGRLGVETPLAILGRPGPPAPPNAMTLAPSPGPLCWRRLDPTVRRLLRRTAWAEVVVLHNQGHDSYRRVLSIVMRTGVWTPLRFFYADGSERRFPSWAAFVARRVPLAAAAWLGSVLLIPSLVLLRAAAPRLLPRVHETDRC